jgi:signal transduction histidine kinase
MAALSLFRTLYARLALGLFILLVIVGGLFTALSLYSVREYTATISQELNRDLASNLVADRNLVKNGQVNNDALKQLFDLYMSINPGIEIYLLDKEGKILSFSANPDKIKRRYVSLEPIHELLTNPDVYPLPGDDPRSHNRRKIFSVTPVPSAEHSTGYLYVVLRGEGYDMAENMAHSNRLLQMGAGALVISLFVGLLAGLVFFHLLTRRLSRLTRQVECFEVGDDPVSEGPDHNPPSRGDDIDYLTVRFDQMSQRIAAQLEQLKDKDHQRRQLVAQVSHDLRTPLASVQGYLEALKIKQKTLRSEERERFLEVALAETHRLGQLVNELFELAALEAQEKQPSSEPFMIAELVHDVVQKHQPEAERACVTLRVAEADAVLVQADIAMVERILDNLINNAIGHSPVDSCVTLRVLSADSGASITVTDMGSGIDQADLAHIFEPFYQGTGASQAGHIGLGLAIAKRMVELQRGHISAQNNAQKGAEFRVWLPDAASGPVPG